ncbi:MAG: quinolinate synthase NadA [Bdellovibrionota bacterium]
MSSLTSLKEEILSLKKQKNAVILAHYYEDGEIQDIADHVGDSLYLAQQGEKLTADVALMAGVVFMAETVKILSPTKTVLVPDLGAGCSLVDHSPFDKYLEWRRQHPTGIAVTYVNSSALVKSITDVACTSSNAEKIIAAIPPGRPILFGPDRNLGRYLAKKLGLKIGSEMILWPGACQVHVLFSARKLHDLKRDNPGAPVLAHPECDEVVLEQADVIGSTSRLLEETQKNPAQKFIVATEEGIFHQMKKSRPDAEFIQAPAEGSCACNQCPYMKMNTLEKVRNALRDLKPQIEVASDIIEKSRIPLRRMLDITAGLKVEWPTEFRG